MKPVRHLIGGPEAAALTLVGLWALWSLVSMVRSDWDVAAALPYLLCPVMLVLGVVAGPPLARTADSSGMRVALVVVAGAMVLGALLVSEPGKAPLGYPNANAALAVQLVGLSGLALLSTPRRRRRPVIVALLLLVAAVGLNRSAAAVAVLVPVAAVVAVMVWRRPTRMWWSVVAVGAGAASAAGAAVVIVRAATAPEFPPWAVAAFDPVREQLWQDAVSLWHLSPVTGSGPGSFRQATSLSADPDTMSAHSSVLQIGSETGWVGVALLGLVSLGGLLWAARGRPAEAVIGSAAWTALLVHSTADHLLEFGSVVLLAGMVTGWAGATRRSEQLDVTEGEGPLPG